MSEFWMGIVENAKDPLKIGRCQVRIHGIHSDNKNLVPTEDLPWSMPQYPANSSRMFATFTEGEYVFGHFPPGVSSQQPIIMGSMPGILANSISNVGEYFTKKDMPNQLPGRDSVGTPTIGALARGDIANSKIAITNSTLTHSCDFRFLLGADINIGVLVNPVTAMQDAIRNGKNKAAMAMGIIMRQIATYLRKIINAILDSLILDRTGEFSKMFSFAKDIFRQVNYYIKEAAKVVEMVSFYYYFVKDITQIVDYLKKMPDYLKSMVKGCIAQFLGSIQTFVNMIKSIPGMALGNIESLLSQLQSDTQSTVISLNSQLAQTANTANTSDILTTVTIYEPDAEHANTILKFIQDTEANANVTIVNATANNFSKDSLQSP